MGFDKMKKKHNKKGIYSFLSLISMPYFAAFLSAIAWIAAIFRILSFGFEQVAEPFLGFQVFLDRFPDNLFDLW